MEKFFLKGIYDKREIMRFGGELYRKGGLEYNPDRLVF
jgi:hypothetical protein